VSSAQFVGICLGSGHGWGHALVPRWAARVLRSRRPMLAAMICPHCRHAFSETGAYLEVGADSDGVWRVRKAQCDHAPCRKWIVELVLGPLTGDELEKRRMVHPKVGSRPVPADVPDPYAQDFREAVVTLPDSAKASAAISRRCLQALIRDKAGIKRSSLSQEIEGLLASGELPSWLAANVDAVRNVGNLAAHPTKDTHTGEIVDVEPGEAEWLLDVLEGLFDFYFVQPAVAERKRDALNAKLKSVGKPPLK
jgi:hypothetical protein